MDPEEIEFIGEKMSIGIIPNFNFNPIHLISSTIGLFSFSK
jgi:GINS complex subunit 2